MRNFLRAEGPQTLAPRRWASPAPRLGAGRSLVAFFTWACAHSQRGADSYATRGMKSEPGCYAPVLRLRELRWKLRGVRQDVVEALLARAAQRDQVGEALRRSARRVRWWTSNRPCP